MLMGWSVCHPSIAPGKPRIWMERPPPSESWLRHGCPLNYPPVFVDGEIVILGLAQALLDPLVQVFKSDEVPGFFLDRQKGESKDEIKAK